MLSNGKTFKGHIEIPNLSEENEPQDIDVSVTVTDEKGEGYDVKEYMRKEGGTIVRQQLAKYIKDLKSGEEATVRIKLSNRV